jgi:hypothetical protein
MSLYLEWNVGTPHLLADLLLHLAIPQANIRNMPSDYSTLAQQGIAFLKIFQ